MARHGSLSGTDSPGGIAEPLESITSPGRSRPGPRKSAVESAHLAGDRTGGPGARCNTGTLRATAPRDLRLLRHGQSHWRRSLPCVRRPAGNAPTAHLPTLWLRYKARRTGMPQLQADSLIISNDPRAGRRNGHLPQQDLRKCPPASIIASVLWKRPAGLRPCPCNTRYREAVARLSSRNPNATSIPYGDDVSRLRILTVVIDSQE